MNSKYWKAVMMKRGAVHSFPTCKLDRPLSAQEKKQSRGQERSGQHHTVHNQIKPRPISITDT